MSDTITGKVDRLIFHKDGFSIFKLLSDGAIYSAKGNVPKDLLVRGQEMTLAGDWIPNQKYGPALQVTKYSGPGIKPVMVNATAGLPQFDFAGVKRFLSTVPYISEVRASQLIDLHGEKVLSLMRSDPVNAMAGIKGISFERAVEIEGWMKTHQSRLDMEIFLHKLGFGDKTREKIESALGPEGLSLVEKDPYRLISVGGIGFKSLDAKILSAKFIAPNSEFRGTAVLTHLLDRAGSLDGHTVLTKKQLFAGASKFGFDDELVLNRCLDTSLANGDIKELDGMFGRAELLDLEEFIAESLVTMLANNNLDSRFKPDRLDTEGLGDDQALGVATMLASPVSILGGGPGCGKTYTIKSLLKNIKNTTEQGVTLCAPTGKAAKRMIESTGHNAQTIHMLLLKKQFAPTVVVDESSMLSTELAADLLGALKVARVSRLIFVGDRDQLPSIGAGRVFGDLIDSGVIPTTNLTKVRRQAEGSNIVMNAARIRNGDPLVVDNESDLNVSFTSPDKQQGLLLKALKTRIPELTLRNGKKLDPLRDLQVIVPQHRGDMGCTQLNFLLQDALNPKADNKAEMTYKYMDFAFTYREGDKILITKNDKQHGVVNGDIGYIDKIEEDGYTVRFEEDDVDSFVAFEKDFLRNTKPGYAVTVHKAQGSEAPMVVVVYNQQTAPMFRQRNMLYTAITRAKERMWLIGSEKVVNEAIANNTPAFRQTGLLYAIDKSLEQYPSAHPLRLGRQTANIPPKLEQSFSEFDM